ncbi:SecY-interacting protein [Alteromonas halophila]|uniref:Protein Syd n=1 Tax=Alteromonas halophila TaxID=516698 RepID=A0A918JBY5_9ALTE|nr:SecY-interacting protein [Alteromonas halophila]GGW73034.1 protein Syd [Alteromonas halophila]
MSAYLEQQLDSFITSTLALSENERQPLRIEYDSTWPSPCYQQTRDDGKMVEWKPVKQTEHNSFANVEEALEVNIDRQYADFFTRYYSHNLLATAPQGSCELLQVWNQDDFQRLQQNIIGHVLMKRRLKQQATLFFALTDEEDTILSVLNDTGEVVVERVGKPPSDIIAPSLASFLEILTPQLP